MSHLINNEQKLNDIIFADRNKAYGAYALRSNYGNTLFKSVSLMLIGVGSIMSVALYLSNKNEPDSDLAGQVFLRDSIYVVSFNNEKEEEEKITEDSNDKTTTTDDKTLAKTESTTIIDSTFTSPETSTNTAVVIVSSVTAEGENGTVSITMGKTGSGVVSGKGVDTNVVNELFGVDSPPEFEGGFNALSHFVSRHLKYPNWAYDQGKEGTVFVKFVVNENGMVGKLSLLNSIGYGMDDEALRVVGLIPKFKFPAKVKGVPVKAYYQIPIRFHFK